MNPLTPPFSTIGLTTLGFAIAAPVMAQQPLFIAYPPTNHETTADRIFLIGTAAAEGEVTVNGEAIDRSDAGHFAPSFPLQIGENRFVIRYQNQEIQLVVTRNSTQPILPQGIDFAKGSLLPANSIARLPGEPICFEAIAPADATVSVRLGNRSVALLPQSQSVALPANNAVLTGNNQPETQAIAGLYQGCTNFDTPGNLGTPVFQLELNGTVKTQPGSGSIEIMTGDRTEVAEVIVDSGTARTGPGTDYSRLTPLPQGTQAAITGKEGDWLRLDYGAWIKAEEVRVFPAGMPPRSLIRSVRASHGSQWTEVFFPLQVPVPVSVAQETDKLTLTLHNTTAQTDTIAFNDNPLVEWMDWQQVEGDRLQYTFHFKTQQQWGYKLRYDGTTLVLSLRHPPKLRPDLQSLAGVTILLDPGHGSDADLGAVGPNGYPEKEVTLRVSQLLRDRLQTRGATVVMTREGDDDILPGARADKIAEVEPTIALSIHYNALPDNGDAVNTAGVGTFWYQPQARDLATFLYNYLVEDLDRPAYGVFWGNLALTRPAVTPSVLLELGFMINPAEFEWIADPAEQEKLADSLAAGITAWIHSRGGSW
ncbi:MAG TPA: N-acetylmuramoyl-L-alanine amidase [Oscillatoriales cyanobacterium M59_W2019_021]|nr:N-acetylmuramoyl-L-alanine amidase [Oscillatoriales cyanobacterium M4454_W2019_049]HIK53175.1 N-acetylmuramoyl-L-alanine amidase [Oscillatoriales cyanobacterium M59_W2019_021]